MYDETDEPQVNELIAFLNTRLNEEEAELKAKRAVVRRCQDRMNELDAYPNGLVFWQLVSDLPAWRVLVDLASAWSDHPDFLSKWAS